jgi:hypothetical protein
MDMVCHCLSSSPPDNAAMRQTSAPFLTPFPCLDQGEDVHANVRLAYVSTGHMARAIIDKRSNSGESAASALNDSMRRRTGCAKVVGEDRLHASTLKRTKAATSSSVQSTA